MLKKLLKFAHSSELVKNLIFYGSPTWVWPNGSVAPPTKCLGPSPRFQFDLHVPNLVGTCYIPRLKEKSLGDIPYAKQEVGHFEFNVQFWPVFAISRRRTLMNSS